MRAGLAMVVTGEERRLYDRIGSFLDLHRLAPDPANYAFAYKVLTDADGPLATAVRALTEGGVRLTRRDIESLGESGGAGGGESLEARTERQVAGFAEMVEAMQHETRGFGRDLAASAGALAHTPRADEVVRLTGAMIERVRAAESRLDAATHEANTLRQELEGARVDARTDPLTGLANRRALEEAFAGMAGPVCLAICDIDRFKWVNDRFGHPVGDRVLRAVGGLIAKACEGATVARFGGEEFAVLFPTTRPSAAVRMIERARVDVAAKRYRVRESSEALGAVTFSAGLVTMTPGESLGDAVTRADALLYTAKSEGRNCVRSDFR